MFNFNYLPFWDLSCPLCPQTSSPVMQQDMQKFYEGLNISDDERKPHFKCNLTVLLITRLFISLSIYIHTLLTIILSLLHSSHMLVK